MSGNGRGNMRPQSRSPPFLLIGLLVALAILAFNYWNLSSRNGDLSKQLESLRVDLRSVSDKHLTVEKRAADLAQQLSDAQNKVSGFERTVGERDAKVQELTAQVEAARREQETAANGMKECQAQLQALRQEKQQVDAVLEQTRSDLEAEKQKERPVPTCDQMACKSHIRAVLEAVTKGVGTSPVVKALEQANVNLSDVAGDLLVVKPEEQQAGGPPQQQVGGPAEGFGQQQAQVERQDPNVVQMGVERGGLFGQQPPLGFGGGVGDVSNRMFGQQQQQQLFQQQQQDQQQQGGQYQVQPSFNGQNPDLNGFQNTNASQDQNLNAAGNRGAGQEIVAQNLPRQPAIDDNSNPNNNVAQEDVNAPDVPPDDMDKQAAANQKDAEDAMGDGHLQQQLHDLSKNDNNAPVVGDFDKDNGIPFNDQNEDQRREEEEEEEDYDRQREDRDDDAEGADTNMEGDVE